MAVLGDTKAVSLTLLDGVIGNLNPKVTTVYNLGTSSLKWNNVYATNFNGNATTATRANIPTTTANAVAYYKDAIGTFGTKASANGALYATEANGTLTFGTLPVAQGGTGATSIANIKAGKDGDGNTISSTYVKTTDLSSYEGFLRSDTISSWALAANKPSYSLSEITAASDVQAIENLTGTSGLLKKTGENTWTLDTNTYALASSIPTVPTNVSSFTNDSGYVTSSGVTSITITAGNGISLNDSSAITSSGTRTVSINGMDTTSGSVSKVLNQKGEWVELPTANSLHLSNALHFIGTTSTALEDGDDTTTTLTPKSTDSLTKTTDFIAGDVVLRDNGEEYVYTGTAWELLGRDSSFKIKQTAITDSTGTAENDTATRFIYSFSQNDEGVVSVKTRPLPTYNNYSLPVAASGTLGGIQIGYSQTEKKYAVQLDSNNKAFVEVPWTNTTYTAGSGLTLNNGAFSVNTLYWANLAATSAAAYNKAPEMATIKLNGNTSATGASSKNVSLIYNSSTETLNFVFA